MKLGFGEVQFDYIRFPEPYTSLPQQVFPDAKGVSKPDALARVPQGGERAARQARRALDGRHLRPGDDGAAVRSRSGSSGRSSRRTSTCCCRWCIRRTIRTAIFGVAVRTRSRTRSINTAITRARERDSEARHHDAGARAPVAAGVHARASRRTARQQIEAAEAGGVRRGLRRLGAVEPGLEVRALPAGAREDARSRARSSARRARSSPAAACSAWLLPAAQHDELRVVRRDTARIHAMNSLNRSGAGTRRTRLPSMPREAQHSPRRLYAWIRSGRTGCSPSPPSARWRANRGKADLVARSVLTRTPEVRGVDGKPARRPGLEVLCREASGAMMPSGSGGSSSCRRAWRRGRDGCARAAGPRREVAAVEGDQAVALGALEGAPRRSPFARFAPLRRIERIEEEPAHARLPRARRGSPRTGR